MGRRSAHWSTRTVSQRPTRFVRLGLCFSFGRNLANKDLTCPGIRSRAYAYQPIRSVTLLKLKLQTLKLQYIVEQWLYWFESLNYNLWWMVHSIKWFNSIKWGCVPQSYCPESRDIYVLVFWWFPTRFLLNMIIKF